MTYDEFEVEIKKHMLLEDKGILKLICAILVASKMPIVKPWILIVGSSSGGKSMLLNGIQGVSGVKELDLLTSNTLLSGARSAVGSASFLHQLMPGSVLCFSDFTTILSLNEEARKAIFSQFRKVWDGRISKATGNGENQDWKGDVTVVGAVTTSIYQALPTMADMGERLVLYHYQMPDVRQVQKFSIRNMRDRDTEELMKKLFNEYLEQPGLFSDTVPELEETDEDDIMDLSDVASLARSSISRNQYSRDQEMTFIHDREMPMRLMKTIVSVALAMLKMNQNMGVNKLLPVDRHVIYRLALDSIPRNRKLVLNTLTRYEFAKSEDIQMRLGMPANLILRVLEDLIALGLVSRQRMENVYLYSLNQKYRVVLSKFENIQMTNEIMTSEGYTPPEKIDEWIPPIEIKF